MPTIIFAFDSEQEAQQAVEALVDEGAGEVRARVLDSSEPLSYDKGSAISPMITPDLGSIEVRPAEIPQTPETEENKGGQVANASIPTTGSETSGVQVMIEYDDQNEEKVQQLLSNYQNRRSRMVVVAGLFDSQADTTQAMDVILRDHIKDLDTIVYESGSRQDTAGTGAGFGVPVVPNTSGSGMGQSGIPAGAAIGAAGIDRDWLNDFDEEERGFYYEGYKEGATLALARVHEEDVDRVREVFRQHNARTYVKD